MPRGGTSSSARVRLAGKLAGTFQACRTALSYSGARKAIRRPPPRRGQDNSNRETRSQPSPAGSPVVRPGGRFRGGSLALGGFGRVL
ncbi:MAG: hypothetical protein ACRDOH_31370, partial [Streptosporangiaceae bacterium]